MKTIYELINIIIQGLSTFSKVNFLISVAISTLLAVLFWWISNNYVQLWRKGFQLIFTSRLLTIIAALLTFIFSMSFAGLGVLQQVAQTKLALWKTEVNTDDAWQNETFKKAYYTVKSLKIEDFTRFPPPESGGHKIPMTKPETIKKAAEVYADATCEHFDENHPFLGKILWSSPKIPTDLIDKNVSDFFKSGHDNYPLNKAVELAANKIKTDLALQTPRVVYISRIILVVCFFLVQLIPFGLIGYKAYRSIKTYI